MDGRDAVLAKIRKALERGEGGERKAPVLFQERSARFRSPKDQDRWAFRREYLLKRFREECDLLSTKVYICPKPDNVLEVLGQVVYNTRAEKGYVSRWAELPFPGPEIDSFLESSGLRSVVSEERINQRGYGESGVQGAEEAEVGITGADYALAETGSLVLMSGEGKDRSVSLLPPKHIALLNSADILPSMESLITEVVPDLHRKGALPSCITLVSGPSKTADIEMNLVHGVHGPEELHVIVLDYF